MHCLAKPCKSAALCVLLLTFAAATTTAADGGLYCSNVCVNRLTDPLNCGLCNNDCTKAIPPKQFCVNGACSDTINNITT